MSLAQHLTAEDEFECDWSEEEESVVDHARGAWRRMSFDAFAPVRPNFDLLADDDNKQHRAAAYKASTLRRIGPSSSEPSK